MQELWHLISLQLHPQLLNCLRGYRHEQEEKEENLKDARMCGTLISTCWNWLNVRSPESPFSKTTNVFNADSSTDGSTLVWRTCSDFKQIPCILGIFLCTWKQTLFFFCRFLSIAVSTYSWQIQFVSQSLASSICQQLFQSSQCDWNKNVSSWPAISRI